VLAGLVVAWFGWSWLMAREEIKAAVARGSLRLPVVGPLLKNMAVARFCRILGTMLGNGIPMLHALEISKDAAGNVILVEALDNARRSVQAGETLADPLEESGLFDEDVIEIVRIGESANNLDEVLVSLSDTIEARVDRLLTTAVRLLEPLLLLLLGGCLLFIILALVIPLIMLTGTV